MCRTAGHHGNDLSSHCSAVTFALVNSLLLCPILPIEIVFVITQWELNMLFFSIQKKVIPNHNMFCLFHLLKILSDAVYEFKF